MAVHESFAMKVGEGVEDRFEHFPGFGRRERPAGNYFRKVFFGPLREDIHKLFAAKLEASHFVNGYQMRMGQFSRLSPTRKLQFAILRSRWNELDDCLYDAISLTMLGEKYRAVFGSAEGSNRAETFRLRFHLPIVSMSRT